MNMPSGEMVEENLELKSIDVDGLLKALNEKQFTGYIVNTVEGFAGLEEGVLLFKKGELVGSFFEYINYGITVFGNDGVYQMVNSLSAQSGVVDIVSLSLQQVDLVVAFNDRLKVTIRFKKSDLLGLLRKPYVASFAQKTLENVVQHNESRNTVLKKLGLSELG